MVLLLPIQLPQQGLLLFAASLVGASILITVTKNRLDKNTATRNSRMSTKSSTNKAYLNNSNLIFPYEVRDHTHDEFQNDILAVINEILPFTCIQLVNDIEISPLLDLSTNLVYLVHLLPLKLKVVIRLFGPVLSDIFDRNQENSILSSLSAQTLSVSFTSTSTSSAGDIDNTIIKGPILYGLFSNGRIERYLPYAALTPQDTIKPLHIPLIAHAISELHCLTVNNISTDICGWRMIESFLKSAQDVIAKASKCNTTTNGSSSSSISSNSSSDENSSSNNNNHYHFNAAFLNQDALLVHHTYIHQMIQEYEWLKTKMIGYSDRVVNYHPTTTPSSTFFTNEKNIETVESVSSDKTDSTFTIDSTRIPITARNNDTHTGSSNNQQPQQQQSSEWSGFVFGLDTVLCHNDLMAGNMLLVPMNDDNVHINANVSNGKNSNTVVPPPAAVAAGAGGDRVILQNFEYAGYNIRAWEIANHFCECAGFEANFQENFPSLPLRVLFYSEYIQSYVRHLLNTTIGTTNPTANTVVPTGAIATNSTVTVNIQAELLYINELLERDGGRVESIFLELATATSNKSQQHCIAVSSIKELKKSQKSQAIDHIKLHEKEDEEELMVLNELENKLSILLTPEEEMHLIQFLSCFDGIVCKFTLLSHLCWGSWAVSQAATSTMTDFDFTGYSHRRFQGYFHHKQMFFPNEAIHSNTTSSSSLSSSSHRNSPSKTANK